METSRFSNQVLAYFYERKGFGRVEPADGTGSVVTERLSIEFSLRELDGRIIDIKYQCPTCVVAIATCSLVVELVQGKLLEEALAITPAALSERLGGIPEERFDRCTFAVTALRLAVYNLEKCNKELIHESCIHLHHAQQSQDS